MASSPAAPSPLGSHLTLPFERFRGPGRPEAMRAECIEELCRPCIRTEDPNRARPWDRATAERLIHQAMPMRYLFTVTPRPVEEGTTSIPVWLFSILRAQTSLVAVSEFHYRDVVSRKVEIGAALLVLVKDQTLEGMKILGYAIGRNHLSVVYLYPQTPDARPDEQIILVEPIEKRKIYQDRLQYITRIAEGAPMSKLTYTGASIQATPPVISVPPSDCTRILARIFCCCVSSLPRQVPAISLLRAEEALAPAKKKTD